MRWYRYYCLHEDGRIGFGTNIQVPDLKSAIDHALEQCSVHPAGPFHGIEIWEDGKCVFPGNSAD